MSAWTHSQCGLCWFELNPDRVPVRVRDDGLRVCCRCGRTHTSGIYVRADPATFLCHGQHADDDDDADPPPRSRATEHPH